MSTAPQAFQQQVRMRIFATAAETGRVPQAPEVAAALDRPVDEVRDAIHALAAGRVLILAPNDGAIWAANPFCAVPSGFRVRSGGRTYWGICAWDALGIAAALNADAEVTAPCGDCSEPLSYTVRDGALVAGAGLIHFAVPARHWWDNIGFT